MLERNGRTGDHVSIMSDSAAVAREKCATRPAVLYDIVLEGDALTVMRELPDNHVQCIVTSPPYWGLRDYNAQHQIGLEPTLPEFIDRLTAVFHEARRVLRDDGVLWLNIGDGYTSGNRGWRAPDKKNPARAMSVRPDTPKGLKSKDLMGIPWRLAFALQDALLSGKFRHVVAIEVKGGRDFSNVHNRIGEAEKSHQKARANRCTECWTVVNVDKIDLAMTKRESPSTDRFYRISDLNAANGPDFEDFRDRIVSLTGIA